MLSVSEASAYVKGLRGVTVSPRLLTDLIYKGAFPFDCPMVGGRRIIEAGHLGDMVSVLEERGYVDREKPAKAKK